MAFKDNLRRLREERGFLNRSGFAKKTLGLKAPTTYDGYEVRGSLPPEDLIIKIAQALNVSIDELFGYNAKTKEKDIDICVKELNAMGIKAVLVEERHEVDIYLNKITRFTSMPYEKVIEMVKTAKNFIILNAVNRHIIYSLVMTDIIRSVNVDTTEKKNPKSIKINLSSPTAPQKLFDTITQAKRCSKKEKNRIKNLLKDEQN